MLMPFGTGTGSLSRDRRPGKRQTGRTRRVWYNNAGSGQRRPRQTPRALSLRGVAMQVRVGYGREQANFEVREGSAVGTHRQPPAADLPDPAAAVRDALEHPTDFPPLRRALTPEDHVAVVVDEELPALAELLTPVLEHLAAAQV